MPKILDAAVNRIKAQSPGVNPYAVATAALQKSGSLKPGTQQATKQGVARGQMTSAEREAIPDRGRGQAPPTHRESAREIVQSYRSK